MKRFVCLVFLSALPLFGQSCPEKAGVYVRLADAWRALEPVAMGGYTTNGKAKSAFSYGFSKVKAVYMYQDAQAPVTLPVAPQFCISGPFEARYVSVVRLTAKKDHRELQFGSGNAYSGFAVKLRPEDMQPVSTKPAGDALDVAAGPLAPGQYILFPSAFPQSAGYDFTVQ
jgi:hypothetical protein